MSESSFHRILQRVLDFLIDIAPTIIKFPTTQEEKERVEADFKDVSIDRSLFYFYKNNIYVYR